MAAKKTNTRTFRIGDEIQKVISKALMVEFPSDHFKWVSITQVEVTRDLSVAKVYYSIMGDTQDLNQRKPNVAEAFSEASGYLRHYIGQQCKLRKLPTLQFLYDDSLVEGARMSKLIDQAIKGDKGDVSS